MTSITSIKEKLEDSKIFIMNPFDGPSKRGTGTVVSATDAGTEIFRIQTAVTVYQLEPLIQSQDSCKTVCQNCFQRIPNSTLAYSCKVCGLYSYCNEKCYLTNWKCYHQYECRPMEPLKVIRGPDEFKRLVLRLCVMYFKPGANDELEGLTDHSEEFENHGDFMRMSESITLLLADEFNLEKMAVFKIICLAAVNSMTAMNERFENVGMSFDKKYSLLNHSCVPNLYVIPISLTEMKFVAASPIQAGAELFTNYTFIACPTEVRKRNLELRYFFNCKCRICKSKKNIFFSYNCPKCGIMMFNISLASFFQFGRSNWRQALEATNPEDHICGSCRMPVAIQLLEKTWTLHKQLVGYLLYSLHRSAITPYDSLGHEVSEFLKDQLQPVPKIDLADELASLGELTMTRGEVDTLHNIVQALIGSDICPIYCFPVSKILSDLESSLLGFDKARAKVQVCFAQLASDLSDFKVSRIGLFRDLGPGLHGCLADIGSKVTLGVNRTNPNYQDDSSNGANSDIIKKQYTAAELRRCIAASSLFFCLQLVLIHRKLHIQLPREIRELQESTVREIKQSAMWYGLKEFLPGKPMTLTKFIPHIQLLAVVTNLSLRLKKCNFWMQYANRDHHPVFVALKGVDTFGV